MRSPSSLVGMLIAGSTLLLLSAACGSSAPADDGSSSGGDQPGGGDVPGGFGPSDPNGGSSSGSSGGSCVGLQCNQISCPGGGTTSLSGKVYLPEGTIPLYNAIVYVPNGPVAPFTPGVTCDKCGTVPSGNPIATAVTDATGSFVLKNVPVDVDVPLVIQIGRWRRQITIPKAQVQRCADAPLAATETRLPRNKAEGDIPNIAITTGNADSLECFLRKLGIDDDEITNPDGTGRVHLYQGRRGSNSHGSRINASTPSGQTLWDDVTKLKAYDMVILSCEGSENNTTKSHQARENMREYLDSGGRVFASHYHYTWYKNTGSGAPGGYQNPLATTATWMSSENAGPQTQNVAIDTTFPKGQDFSTWMDTVGATTAPRSELVPMTELRRSVKDVNPATSRRWLHGTESSDPGVEYNKFFTFNTPIGAPADQQCGRAVYTDIHVSSGDNSGGTFPNNCVTSGFTAQEKALLFLLMDLAACIQDDNQPPVPPPPVKGPN